MILKSAPALDLGRGWVKIVWEEMGIPFGQQGIWWGHKLGAEGGAAYQVCLLVVPRTFSWEHIGCQVNLGALEGV